jgi:hypothetical protein
MNQLNHDIVMQAITDSQVPKGFKSIVSLPIYLYLVISIIPYL